MMVLKENRLRLNNLILRSLFSKRARNKLGACHLSRLRQVSYGTATLTRDKRYLYFGNGKAAGSSIRQLLYFYQTGRFLEGSFFDIAVKNSPDALKIGIDYWQDFFTQETNPKCYVFSFVRDPMDRLISCFFNKVINSKNSQRNPHIQYLEKKGFDPKANHSLNFAIFVEYVARQLSDDPYYCDHHIRTQTINLAFDEIQYDFIGRIEAFKRDIKTVFLHEPGSYNIASHLDDIRENPSKKDPLSISKITRSIIYEAYNSDYENFGYQLH